MNQGTRRFGILGGNHSSRALPSIFRCVLTLACAIAPFGGAIAAGPASAVGVVFDDATRNGVRDPGEAGIAGVCVSNGRDVVKTDHDGRYQLEISDDTILFVIKPRGWTTPVTSDNLPRFYYIHKPGGSPPGKSPYPGVAPTGPLPASVDFPLYKRTEPDRFEVLVFGDTQPADRGDIAFLAHDLVEELLGAPAAFGVTLGDVVHEKLTLYEPLTQVLGRIGVPWYYVIGNHDRNYGSTAQEYFDETFERVFGPTSYAIQFGPVHFLMLNDIQAAGDEKYRAGLGEKQLDFVQNYLAQVPRDALVVLMAHIPIGELPDAERRRLFDALQPRPHNLVLAAHYHFMQHVFFGPEQGWNAQQPLHQLINATACGSWWSGPLDEVGLPPATMADGAPNGYSLVTFDKDSYSIRFKAARRQADYQMNIFAPDEVATGDAAPTELLVNVFAGSARSVVEMQIDGAGSWVRLEAIKRPDPYLVRMKELEKAQNPPGSCPSPSIRRISGAACCRIRYRPASTSFACARPTCSAKPTPASGSCACTKLPKLHRNRRPEAHDPSRSRRVIDPRCLGGAAGAVGVIDIGQQLVQRGEDLGRVGESLRWERQAVTAVGKPPHRRIAVEHVAGAGVMISLVVQIRPEAVRVQCQRLDRDAHVSHFILAHLVQQTLGAVLRQTIELTVGIGTVSTLGGSDVGLFVLEVVVVVRRAIVHFGNGAGGHEQPAEALILPLILRRIPRFAANPQLVSGDAVAGEVELGGRLRPARNATGVFAGVGEETETQLPEIAAAHR
jgi:hypothetical protein